MERMYFLMSRTIAERELSAKDNRNLYLLSEGVIDENHRGDMNDRGNNNNNGQ